MMRKIFFMVTVGCQMSNLIVFLHSHYYSCNILLSSLILYHLHRCYSQYCYCHSTSAYQLTFLSEQTSPCTNCVQTQHLYLRLSTAFRIFVFYVFSVQFYVYGVLHLYLVIFYAPRHYTFVQRQTQVLFIPTSVILSSLCTNCIQSLYCVLLYFVLSVFNLKLYVGLHNYALSLPGRC